MQKARMVGNYIQHLAEERHISTNELSELLGCTESQTKSFLKGRALASFEQLQRLAAQCGISAQDILNGDSQAYNKTVVHCMNEFEDNANRELILDLIDEYMDLVDAVRDADVTRA